MKMKEIGVDEDSIQALGGMGIKRDDAVACLKACNGNLERAAEYFWNGDLEKDKVQGKWDESLWSVPREGPALPPGPDNNFSQFRIQSPDALAPSVFEPKSRPPSRVSNRAGLTTDDNDPELARALAASLQDSSGNQSSVLYSQQETGITGTHTSPTNPNFRDAVLDRDYDPNQWALTTTQTHEIFLDPSPEDRKRSLGEPVFLRPSNSGSNLSAALTILHSIPLAREGFLVREHVLSDYGHDDQWWNGQRVGMLRIIDVDDEESQVPEEIVETQRLMAFLDQSARAYGSVEGLAVMHKLQDDSQNVNLSSFFQGWTSAVDQATHKGGEDGGRKYTSPFLSNATQRAREATVLEKGVEVEDKHQSFQVLDVIEPPDEDATFYDALDKVIWADGDDSEVFVDFADVFCISIKPDQGDILRRSCRLDIPPIFYPDRYTEAWTERVRVVRKEMEEKRCVIDEIEVKEEKLKKFRSSKGGGRNPPVYEPKILLESVIEYLSTAPDVPNTDGDSGGTSMESQEDGPTKTQQDVIMESQRDISMESQDDIAMESHSDSLDTVQMLKAILSKLEEKLTDLSLRKKEARETFKRLKLAFTSPETSDPAMPTLTKYSLRGVCADPTTTYVLIPVAEPRGLFVDDPSTANLPIEQWWCLRWGPPQVPKSGWDDTPTASYEVKKVTEPEVLEAIKTTGYGPLLVVYANENALAPKGGIDTSLPAPLQIFIDKDNIAFKAELQPTSPGRKRHNDWIEDDDEAVDIDRFSPKKMSSSSRSSVTLGNVTPQQSRRNSPDGIGMEMTEGVDLKAGSGGEVGLSFVEGSNAICPTIELPPPHQEEMIERGHISPVAKAFHRGREKDIDQEMTDAEHVEYTSATSGGEVKQGII